MKLTLNTDVPQGGVKGGSGKRVKDDNLCLNKEDLWGWSAQSTAGESAERAELLGTSEHKREWSHSKFQKGQAVRSEWSGQSHIPWHHGEITRVAEKWLQGGS